MRSFTVISLGWGVQSFTMAVMSTLGDLPKIDVAIHANTLHEGWGTYEFARLRTPWLEQNGVRVITVRSRNTQVSIDRDGDNSIIILAFTNTPTSSGGRLRRQCTGKWKIEPIRKWLQANRNGQSVELWIGISTDEALRMKPSGVKYITNRWPLIEKGMSRKDCTRWLYENYYGIPPKSSCVFCPFHTVEEWRKIKTSKKDWNEAIAVDRAIRKLRPPYDLFVHQRRRPLEEVDLRTLEEKGQLRLWNEECTGMCGV